MSRHACESSVVMTSQCGAVWCCVSIVMIAGARSDDVTEITPTARQHTLESSQTEIPSTVQCLLRTVKYYGGGRLG